MLAGAACENTRVPNGPLALLALGFGLGLRHALDVDHLAAVTAMVSRERSVGRSSAIGALWGIGHGTALLAVSLAVIGLRAEIPPSLARGLELGVAAMLVGIGSKLLWSLARGAHLHHHAHRHGSWVHSHPHLHTEHAHAPSEAEPAAGHHQLGRRAGASGPSAGGRRQPLLIGMMHGLAGSAGLMLVVLAAVPSPGLAFVYVLTFAIGSILGMMLMSALVGLPFRLLGERFDRGVRVLEGTAAAASIAVGIALAMSV